MRADQWPRVLLTDEHRAKIVLWYICDYLREQQWAWYDMEEWGRNIREIGLLEFQQRVGAKVPREDWSEKGSAPRQRKLQEKKDYEKYIEDLREHYRQKI